MVSNDDVAAKRFLPHDFLPGLDVHGGVLTGHGEDHHGIVSIVHGVDFAAFDVGDGGRPFLDHGHVDGIRDRSDV